MVENVDKAVNEVHAKNMSSTVGDIIEKSKEKPELLQENIEYLAKKCVELAVRNNSSPETPSLNEGNSRSLPFVQKTLLTEGLATLIKMKEIPREKRLQEMNDELNKAASLLEENLPGTKTNYNIFRKDGPAL